MHLNTIVAQSLLALLAACTTVPEIQFKDSALISMGRFPTPSDACHSIQANDKTAEITAQTKGLIACRNTRKAQSWTVKMMGLNSWEI